MKIKIPESILAALDYFIMFDPISLVLTLLVALSGYATQQMVATDSPPWWETGFDLTVFLAFLSVFLFAGGIFILNQINHKENQVKTNHLSPIESGNINFKIAKKIAVIALIVALAVLLLLQKLMLAAFVIIIILIRGLLHNFLQISKKEKGILWLVSNVIFANLLFLFGWLIKGTLDFNLWRYFAPYSFQTVSLLILIFLLDGNKLYKSYKEGDKVVQMGENRIMIWLSAILAVSAFLLGLENNDPLISHSMLLSLVLYLFLIFKLDHLWIVRTISYSLLFFVFFISSQYPWFFLFAIISYYVSKKYYSNRMDIEFPNFGSIEQTEVSDAKN